MRLFLLVSCCFIFLLCSSFQRDKTPPVTFTIEMVGWDSTSHNLRIAATLKNRAQHSVYYWYKEAAWIERFYIPDNKLLRRKIKGCDQCQLTVFELRPMESVKEFLTFSTTKGIENSYGQKLSLSFNFYPASEQDYLSRAKIYDAEEQYLLTSNSVEIPCK